MIPGTIVKLLTGVKCPRDLTHTFTFPDVAAQTAYFSSKLYGDYTATNFTYQRETGKMRVPFHAESLHPVNYLMFQNANYSNKWFYAFVDSIEYKSESSSEINFTIDPWQSYYFDINFRPSLIEREHVTNDIIGLHRVPENLDVGEMVTVLQEVVNISELCVVVASTYNPITASDVSGQFYSGVYQGCGFFTFSASNVSGLNSFLAGMAGKYDAIMGIFMYPKNLLYGTGYNEGGLYTGATAENVLKSFAPDLSSLGTYTPRNKKLFTYPFNVIYATNHNGGQAVYKIEDFDDFPYPQFRITADVAPNPTVYLMPMNYRMGDENYEESVALTQYPFCSWNYDTYRNYLMQNIVSAPLSLASSGLGLATGIATKNPLTIASGVIGMADTIGSFVEKSFLPNTAKGTLSGSGTVAIGAQNISIQQKTAHPKVLAVLDDFFDVYGYKVLRVDYPQGSINTRPFWNYLKLAEVNLFGNMPHNYAQQIRDVLLRGVTFWHDDGMFDYTRDNGV